MKELFSIAAILIGVIGLMPYLWGIYKQTTKPHMFSWIIWAVVSGVAGYIQLTEDAGAGSWFLLANTGLAIGIAIASYWLGTKDIKSSDWIVLFVALSSIPLCVATKNPLWSVIIVVGIDTIGYIPTVRKSWTKPYEESALSWTLTIPVYILTILALESYSTTTYLYPLTFTIVNTMFVSYLFLRRRSVTTGT